jgi:small subunit ribosomal protein S4
MARYTGPKHRLARREGVNLLDKSSASLQRRLNIKPGMHGAKKSRRRLSEYGQQLREKQKAKTMYGVLERQFKRLVTNLEKQKGDTSELMLSLLETRLDNLVYRLGFAKSRFQARQFVSHGHIRVNGKKLNIPSYQVKLNDIIEIDDKMQQTVDVIKLFQDKTELVSFVSREGAVGKLKRMPKSEDIVVPFNTQQIIEYYSR